MTAKYVIDKAAAARGEPFVRKLGDEDESILMKDELRERVAQLEAENARLRSRAPIPYRANGHPAAEDLG